jgi:hypothetical protein
MTSAQRAEGRQFDLGRVNFLSPAPQRLLPQSSQGKERRVKLCVPRRRKGDLLLGRCPTYQDEFPGVIGHRLVSFFLKGKLQASRGLAACFVAGLGGPRGSKEQQEGVRSWLKPACCTRLRQHPRTPTQNSTRGHGQNAGILLFLRRLVLAMRQRRSKAAGQANSSTD